MEQARLALQLEDDQSLAMPADELEERARAWVTKLFGSVESRLGQGELLTWALMILPSDDPNYRTAQLLVQLLEGLRRYPAGGVAVIREHLDCLQDLHPDPQDAWRIAMDMQEVFGSLQLGDSPGSVIPCPNGDWIIISQRGVQRISDRALRRLG